MLFHAMKMQCYRSWLCAASLAGARRVRQPPSVRSYIQHISQQKSRPLRNYQKRWSMLQSCQAVSHYCTSKQPTEGETVKAQWEPDGATSSTKEAGFSHIPEMPSDADNAIQEQAVMVGENEDGMGEALLASEVEVSNHETAGVKSPTKKKWAANKKSGVPKSSATGTNIKSTLKNHETLLKGIRSKVKTILYQAEGSVDTEAEINDLQEKCDKLFSWLTEENKKIEMKERSTVAMEFLKVMRKLEQSSEIPSVVKVKDWLVENLDGLSVAVLADLYQMYINSPVSEERSSILTQTLERLRSGVSSPEDTFHLLVRSRDADLIEMFLPVIKANLGKMQFREFSLLMQSMASVQDRNKVIINMICSSLADRFEELEVRKKPVAQVVSLVESLARLHIYNGDLLEKLAQVLVQNKRFMSAAQVLELLSSLSHLRLRDPMLLAFIDSEIDQKHMVLGRAFPKKLADVLLSFANLNYVPEYSWISEPMFWSYFETTPVQHKHVWLDMIWSLVILNKALPDQIQSVLSPSFYEPLLKTFEEKDAGVQQNLACRKLLQINASANLDMEGTYEGELLPEDFITRYNVKPPSIPKVSLVHALSKVVKLQAVSEDCFKENVFLDSGHLIHVELLLNQQGFYVPLDKEHSDDVFRVAVIVMDFPFMTLGDVQPVGAFALTIRHLEKLGYLVVEIPYTELGVESKVNVLSNALKRAVQSRIADQLSEAV